MTEFDYTKHLKKKKKKTNPHKLLHIEEGTIPNSFYGGCSCTLIPKAD